MHLGASDEQVEGGKEKWEEEVGEGKAEEEEGQEYIRRKKVTFQRRKERKSSHREATERERSRSVIVIFL